MKECNICFEENIDFVTLECNHELCTGCRDRILETSSKCPFCQRKLKPLEQPEVTPETTQIIRVVEPRRVYIVYPFSMKCKCLIYSFVVLVIILSMNEAIFRPKAEK
jgi:hypothetical protein